MKATTDAEIIDNPIYTTWIDDKGIVHGIVKTKEPMTLADSRYLLSDIKRFTGREKFCVLIEINNAATPDAAVYEFIKAEIPKLVKAVALISSSTLKRKMANMYFALGTLPFPIKVLATAQEGNEWLENYI